MKRTTKWLSTTLALALLGTALLGVLAGCGSGKKELVFWNPFTGSDGDNMQAMVDGFNETNPAYTIKNVSLAGDDMYTKIPTVVNSNKDMPDFGVIHLNRINGYVEQGIIQPLDEVLAKQPGLTASSYLASAWEYGDIGGSQYAIPLDMNGTVLYYNIDLVEQYAPGVLDDDIVTLDELYAVGDAFAAAGLYAFGGSSFNNETFFNLCLQLGNPLAVDEQPNIDTDTVRQVLAIMMDIQAQPWSTSMGDDNYHLFASGEIAFCPEGTWTRNALVTEYEDLNWGVTNMPTATGEVVNWMTSHQMVVYPNGTENDEKQETIAAFFEYVRENSIEWAASGQIVASLDTLNDPAFGGYQQSFFLENDTARDALFIPTYRYTSYITDAVSGVLEDILYGNITVDEGLAKAQQEAEDMIAEYQKGQA